MRAWMIALAGTFVLSGCATARGPAHDAGAMRALPALGAREPSVSGLSSGAFMSVQLAVIHSSRFVGAGFFAGGAYGCAQGRADRAVLTCMGAPAQVDARALARTARERAVLGLIDDTTHLARGRYLIVQGRADPVVKPVAAEKLRDFFGQLGANPRLLAVEGLGHGIPRSGAAVPCAESRAPWMNDCPLDGPGEVLRHIYGFDGLKPTAAVASSLHRFSQLPYLTPQALMADEGHVYIPEKCARAPGSCRLHVVLHGCAQDPSVAGESLVRDGGYGDWAEAAGLIVLYPATKKSGANPQGCWDWWGYTGPGYAMKAAEQVKAIMAMVDALTTAPNVGAE